MPDVHQSSKVILIGSSFFLSLANPAQADPPPERPTIDVSVQGAAKPDDTLESQQAKTVTSANELRQGPAPSVPDALRRTPGVAIQQTTPGQGTVYVRGMSSREVLLTVDGVRLNGAMFRAGNNPYIGLIDPYAVRQAAVLRGTSSVEYGSDALGGVIALKSTLPGYSLEQGGTTRYFALQHVWTNGPGSASRVAMAHASREWTAHVGMTAIAQGNVRPGEGEQTPVPLSYEGRVANPGEAVQPDSSSRQLGTRFYAMFGDFALRRRTGPGSEVVVRGQFGMRPSLVRYDQVTPRFKRLIPAQAWAEQSMSRSMLSVDWQRRAPVQPIDALDVSLWWQRIAETLSQRGWDDVCLGPSDDEGSCEGAVRWTASKQVKRETNRSDAFGLRVQARSQRSDKKASIRVGIDGVYDRVSSEAHKLSIEDGSEKPASERYPDGSAQTQLGAFVTGEWHMLPSLRAKGGVRAGLYRLDIHARTMQGSESPAMHQNVLDYAASAGLQLRIAPGAVWVANAARGIRAANVNDLSTLGSRAGNRYQVPSDDLRPEHSTSLDTGLKLARGWIKGETFVFHLRHEGAISIAPTTVDGRSHTAAGERIYASVNAGYVEQYGIESAWTVALTPELEVFATGLSLLGTQHNPQGLVSRVHSSCRIGN